MTEDEEVVNKDGEAVEKDEENCWIYCVLGLLGLLVIIYIYRTVDSFATGNIAIPIDTLLLCGILLLIVIILCYTINRIN